MMDENRHKDVINNNRLTATIIETITPEILDIFEIPLTNSLIPKDNLALLRHIKMVLLDAFIALANVANTSRSMLYLNNMGRTDMTTDDIEDFYVCSCKGVTKSAFLNIDSYISQAMLQKLEDIETLDDEIIKAYGERFDYFGCIIGEQARNIEDYCISI